MVAAGLELIAVESEPQQPASHAIFLVISNAPSATGFFLAECLLTECQTKLNIGFNLPRMGSGVEQPKLDCSFGKGGV